MADSFSRLSLVYNNAAFLVTRMFFRTYFCLHLFFHSLSLRLEVLCGNVQITMVVKALFFFSIRVFFRRTWILSPHESIHDTSLLLHYGQFGMNHSRI